MQGDAPNVIILQDRVSNHTHWQYPVHNWMTQKCSNFKTKVFQQISKYNYAIRNYNAKPVFT